MIHSYELRTRPKDEIIRSTSCSLTNYYCLRGIPRTWTEQKIRLTGSPDSQLILRTMNGQYTEWQEVPSGGPILLARRCGVMSNRPERIGSRYPKCRRVDCSTKIQSIKTGHRIQMHHYSTTRLMITQGITAELCKGKAQTGVQGYRVALLSRTLRLTLLTFDMTSKIKVS